MSSTGPTLRDLARAFAKGELARDEYRRSRSALVTSILAGEIQVRNIDFPPPIAPPSPDSADPTEPRPRRRSGSTPAAADSDITAIVGTGTAPQPARARPMPEPEPEPGKSKWIVAGIMTLGVIAGAGYFLNPADTGDAAPPPGDETVTTPLPAPVAVDPLAEAGSTLIENFMKDRSWSAERLAAFRSDWSMLTLEQQSAALKSTEAGRLASAIYQRLLEERALSGLGDAEASLAKQRELVGFAAAIGINDPRLTVPEPAAAAVEPASPGVPAPE